MNLSPCPICTVRHGIALVQGCCICSGHVKLGGNPPGGTLPHHSWTPTTTKEQQPEPYQPKIGKKERLRLEKALGRK